MADPGFPRRGAPTSEEGSPNYYLDGEWARIPSAHLDPPLMAHMSVISISFRFFPEKNEIHLSALVICACPADREGVNALKKFVFVHLD